jgi:hypothetical protein
VKPRVFVGSASESKNVALAVQENLEDCAEVTVWPQDVFRPTEFSLESLWARLTETDFGVFILTEDDQATIRQRELTIPRDNVIFELGLFMGRRGREHCFILKPRGAPALHILSDLAGITVVDFDLRQEDLVAATGAACNRIRREIKVRSTKLDRCAVEIMNDILQVAARLIARRTGLKEEEVRGFCHLFDHSDSHLVPVAMYTGIRQDEDRHVRIPCLQFDDPSQDWYIISRAFRQNRFQCAEVDWSKDLKRVEGADRVWPELKAIVAYPIRNEKENSVIGTISFDSSKGLSETGWQDDTTKLRDTLSLLSKTVSSVLCYVHSSLAP